MRNIASYYIAVGQRFATHAATIFGVIELAKGDYIQGTTYLAPVPLVAMFSRRFFPDGEIVENSKNVIDYLVGADIPRYIKAQEKMVDKIEKRGIPIKAVDYYSYPWIFIGRYAPTALLIDGIRRVFSQETKFSRYVALGEIAYPIYRYARDYVRYRRMIIWTKFMEALSEEWPMIEEILTKHLQQKNSGNKTGT